MRSCNCGSKKSLTGYCENCKPDEAQVDGYKATLHNKNIIGVAYCKETCVMHYYFKNNKTGKILSFTLSLQASYGIVSLTEKVFKDNYNEITGRINTDGIFKEEVSNGKTAKV